MLPLALQASELLLFACTKRSNQEKCTPATRLPRFGNCSLRCSTSGIHAVACAPGSLRFSPTAALATVHPCTALGDRDPSRSPYRVVSAAGCDARRLAG